MTEADEVAESLLPLYWEWLEKRGMGGFPSYKSISDFVMKMLSHCESYAVIDRVTDSLKYLVYLDR